MRTKALVGMLGLLVAVGSARANGVVAVTDTRVAQYNEAIKGAHEQAGGIQVVDLSAADITDRIKNADVILAVGQKALQIATNAAPNSPTVFCMVLGSSAVASRTVTGVHLEVAAAGQLEQLREVSPAAKRIAVIYDPKVSSAFLEDATKAAGRLGITLIARPIHDAKEVRQTLSDVAGSIDALWLVPDPRLITAEMFNYLLVFTLERKVALFGFLGSFTQAGALASVAPDYKEIGRRAAKLANELAARPAGNRIPVPTPVSAPGELTINLKTAKQLSLDIAPGVLSKAHQVYR